MRRPRLGNYAWLCGVAAMILPLVCCGEATPAIAPGEFHGAIPYASYLKFEVREPSGPVFDIRDYGAVGDGKSLNTSAIGAAVSAAAEAGGGTVRIAGGDYVTGTVLLKSGITLYLARDAVLRASRAIADYPTPHLLYAEDAAGIRITGPGRIAGEGEAWWIAARADAPLTPPAVFNLDDAVRMHFLAKRRKGASRPSPLIHLRACRNVRVDNLLIENSPGWTLCLDRCEGARIERVIIDNNYHGPNTDGIDISGSSHVRIDRCFVSTGDDGIVLKNGFAKGMRPSMEDIRVHRCFVRSSTNCFKIGTETWGDISNVRVSNCRFAVERIWPVALSGIAIESVDGARVRDIAVRNIAMHNVMTPVFIRLGNRNRWNDKGMQGALEQVRIRNIEASGVESPCIISGIPGLRAKNIALRRVHFSYREGSEQVDKSRTVPEAENAYPEFFMFGDLPVYGLYARHLDGLILRQFKAVPRQGNQREPFHFEDVAGLNVR